MAWIKSFIYSLLQSHRSLAIKFPYGASLDLIRILFFIFTKFLPFPLADFASEKEIQSHNQKPSPRAMEFASYWKHTPLAWLSTPS